MPEPLSKFKVFCGCGDEMKMGDYDPDMSAVSYKCSIGCGNQVFIEPDLDQLSPDVEEIKKILHDNFDSFFHQVHFYIEIEDWYNKGIEKSAQEIINKMNVWITKPKVFGMDVKVDEELCLRTKGVKNAKKTNA